MSDDYIREIVRDEINKMFREAEGMVQEVTDALGPEAKEFTKMWNSLFGIEGDAAA